MSKFCNKVFVIEGTSQLQVLFLFTVERLFIFHCKEYIHNYQASKEKLSGMQSRKI